MFIEIIRILSLIVPHDIELVRIASGWIATLTEFLDGHNVQQLGTSQKDAIQRSYDWGDNA